MQSVALQDADQIEALRIEFSLINRSEMDFEIEFKNKNYHLKKGKSILLQFAGNRIPKAQIKNKEFLTVRTGSGLDVGYPLKARELYMKWVQS